MLSSRTQTRTIGLAAALTVAVALLLNGSARAQNPGADQYTPIVPSGSGPAPTTSPGSGQPQANSAPSTGDVAPAPATAPAPTTTTPQEAPQAAVTEDPAPARQRPAEPKRNGDQRTLDGIAASAKQELTADQDKAAAARLLRDDGSDSGLGVFFWVLIGGTVLWALLTAVSRRRNGGEPDSAAGGASRLGPRDAA